MQAENAPACRSGGQPGRQPDPLCRGCGLRRPRDAQGRCIACGYSGPPSEPSESATLDAGRMSVGCGSVTRGTAERFGEETNDAWSSVTLENPLDELLDDVFAGSKAERFGNETRQVRESAALVSGHAPVAPSMGLQDLREGVEVTTADSWAPGVVLGVASHRRPGSPSSPGGEGAPNPQRLTHASRAALHPSIVRVAAARGRASSARGRGQHDDAATAPKGNVSP